MSGRVHYMFGGSEADSESPPITIGMPRSYSDDRRRVPSPVPFFDDAPLTDDERDLRAADWPTTRKYPRTLSGCDSAYPKSAAYGDAFDRFSDSCIEQDQQRETLFRKWRPIFATAGVLAVFAGIGVILAWRG